MNYHNVRFSAAYGTSAQLPASIRPEVSFAGRSNVGKSSLLNKLFNRKNLAKTSQTPGKTATINFFEADGAADFVDLPGYGYAKVSKSEKTRWAEMIEGYFNQDRDFCLVVTLIDVRHDASALDMRMVEFLKAARLPFAVAFTKADKLGSNKARSQTAALRRQLGLAEAGVESVLTSSASGQGIDELRSLIEGRIAAMGQS